MTHEEMSKGGLRQGKNNNKTAVFVPMLRTHPSTVFVRDRAATAHYAPVERPVNEMLEGVTSAEDMGHGLW